MGYLLVETALLIRQRTDAALGDLGLSSRAFGVLSSIREIPASDQLSLSRARRLDPATLVKILDGLQNRGLIERVQDPDDRRRNRLRVTEAGFRAAEAGREIVARVEREIFPLASGEEMAALRRTLAGALATDAARADGSGAIP